MRSVRPEEVRMNFRGQYEDARRLRMTRKFWVKSLWRKSFEGSDWVSGIWYISRENMKVVDVNCNTKRGVETCQYWKYSPTERTVRQSKNSHHWEKLKLLFIPSFMILLLFVKRPVVSLQYMRWLYLPSSCRTLHLPSDHGELTEVTEVTYWLLGGYFSG